MKDIKKDAILQEDFGYEDTENEFDSPPAKFRQLMSFTNQVERSSTDRILIVDDEPFNLIGLRVILNSIEPNLDSLIDTARNGLEALQAAKNEKYRVIFMDCNMPIMDGYEATDKIREHYKD